MPGPPCSGAVVQSESATMGVGPRLPAVFEAVFGRESSQLSKQAAPATIESWDSLNHVYLVLALEAEFGVQFDAEEIANLISVGAIQRRLERASGSSPARAAS